jgi:lycopene beta-cyclase
MQEKKHFDFILCGGGMAGLSLAYYLINSTLKHKKIAIIEPADKDKNDRTWCFWEEGKGSFDEILYKKWSQIQFGNEAGVPQMLDIGFYNYKMIRGIDFYNFTIPKIKNHPSISWIKESVVSITENEHSALVETESGLYTADYVFESIYKPNLNLDKYINLLQHFMGWVIEVKEPTFNPELPMMMNFGIEQHNDCRFMYVLPHSDRKAIVEYTIFSEKLLDEADYEAELKRYIKAELKIDNYTIDEVEFGVIPMSDEPMEQFVSKRIIRIGTSGGGTNPATGYTFQGVQKNLQKIVTSLEKTNEPYLKTSFFEKRFKLYQSTLLNVLQQKRLPAASVFSRLYDKNPAWKIFRFLDNETNFLQEISIMWSTNKPKFIAAVWAVCFRR